MIWEIQLKKTEKLNYLLRVSSRRRRSSRPEATKELEARGNEGARGEVAMDLEGGEEV